MTGNLENLVEMLRHMVLDVLRRLEEIDGAWGMTTVDDTKDQKPPDASIHRSVNGSG